MFTLSFVNFLQISVATVTLFGFWLLAPHRQYRSVRLLLALVCLAAVFNLLEELNITRDIHLVTPVFVIGFGPAIFLAVKGLTSQSIHRSDYLHLAPMVFALPFTGRPELVIAAGTIWRIVYAVLSLKLLVAFNQRVKEQRSDAHELSLTWLFWSVLIMTIVSALNLVRLNLQPYIDVSTNQLGQGISTAIGLVVFAIIIKQLVEQNDAFSSLSSTVELPSSCEQQAEDGQNSAQSKTVRQEDVEHYHMLFEQLASQMLTNKWYLTPRLTLNQLSQLSGIQVRDISRAINLASQQNFNDYINRLRIEEVKKQLEHNPDDSILTLALNAGFNSKSSFNQIFKQFESMTPTQYRNKNKNRKLDV